MVEIFSTDNYFQSIAPGVNHQFIISFFPTYTPDLSGFNNLNNTLNSINAGSNYADTLTLRASEVQFPIVEVVYQNIPTVQTKRNHRVAVGQNISGNLIIKRGVLFSDEYYSWLEDVTLSLEDPNLNMYRNCIIQQRNAYGKIIRVFTMTKCRPVNYKGPNLNSLNEGIAIEELSISVEGEFTSVSATTLGLS